MKRLIKYLCSVVLSVFMFSMTAFASENDIYLFDKDEYMIAETDAIFYTTDYRFTPANIGIHIVGVTNKGNLVVKNWCDDCYIYDALSPVQLSPTFNPAYGKQIDQATAYNMLVALKNEFPEGMLWDDFTSYKRPDKYGDTDWTACSAFAWTMSDRIFGVDRPSYYHSDFDSIKVGDIIYMWCVPSHAVVVLENHDNYVIIAEGNYNSTVHWGRKISKATLKKCNSDIITRY